MKKIVYLAMLMFSIVLLGSCSKENVEPSNPIIGQWDYVSSEYYNISGDWVNDVSGEWGFGLTFTTDKVKMYIQSGVITYDWQVTNSILTLTNGSDGEIDFENRSFTILETNSKSKMNLELIPSYEGETIYRVHLSK